GEAAAVHGPAAEDEPRTDTAADADEHDVAVRLAEAVLGERGGVGVVGDEHGQPGGGLEDLLQGELGPAEVGGGEHGAGEVDDAGRADADAEDGLLGGRDEFGDEVQHDGGDLGPGGAVGRDLAVGEDVAVDVEHGPAEDARVGEVG